MAQQMHYITALNEVEGAEREDAVWIQLCVKTEVGALQCREAGGKGGRLSWARAVR